MTRRLPSPWTAPRRPLGATALLFLIPTFGQACAGRATPIHPSRSALEPRPAPPAAVAPEAPVAVQDRPADAGCDDNGWCWENPRPRALRARALWGSASDDVWAVAYGRGMLHWDGERWSAEARSFRDQMLSAVWGRDRRDVWVVGGGHGAWHWDGESWVARPGGGAHWDYLVAVGGGDDGPVWTAGHALCTWTGASWQVRVDPPCEADGCSWPAPARSAGGGRVAWRERWWNGAELVEERPAPTGRTFGGTRESSIWLYADRLEKWDGARWVRLDEPPSLVRTPGWGMSVSRPPQHLKGLWGASDDDVWVVGEGGVILRWDGVHLTRTDSPTHADLVDVWGSGPGDVWATGPGALLHWDGARWRAWTSTVADARLNDVWGTEGAGAGGPEVWAVGLGGTILHRARGSWSPVASGVAADLSGVAGSGPGDVWFVGDRGTILHFDGHGVSRAASPTEQDLSGVWAPSANDAWAVGAQGKIVHWNGSGWSSRASPTNGPLRRVYGASGGRPYVVGVRAYEMDADGRFSLVPREAHDARYVVHDARFGGAPLDDVDPLVWATPAKGGLVSGDGSRWSSPPGASAGALRAAWASAGGDVWAVGDEATILVWRAGLARARRGKGP